ncbi:MAG: diguanylate cyclase [Planctomycetota bacterium]|nr:diguanylate cyclase [Planctomycetota bacterium]
MPTKNFQELKATGALPSPPGVGLEILRLTNKFDCSIEELAAAIQIDPVLTSRLLQVANTSAVRGSQPCATIQAAAMRLGLRSVRAIGLGFSLVSGHRAGRCSGFNYDAFWSQSLARAVASAEIATRCKIGEAAELFVAGLLSDIGTLALATVHPTDFAEILTRPEASDPSLRASLEQKRFGIDHAEAGVSMLQEWALPEAIVQAISTVDLVAAPSTQHGATMSLPSAVWIAARFATALTNPTRRPVALAEARRALENLPSIAKETLPELWITIAKSWRSWGAVLDIVTTEVPPFEEARTPTTGAESATKELVAEVAITKPQGARILIVDDDPTTVRLLLSLLQREGHAVVTATGAKEALRLAFENMPQILICDRNMPEMDGVTLIRNLRQFEAGRRVYAILLTADDTEEQAVSGLDAGADDYLVKPFRPKLLMARLRAAMRVIHLQERVDEARVTMQGQVADLGVLARNLQHAAITDTLTGLPNRRFAMDHLREEWQRAFTARSPLSLLILDVDRFKRVNDTFGHAAGDAVLTLIAKVLQTSVASQGTACRIGGEEFVVILPGADAQRARMIAEALRAAIANTPVRGPKFECMVTASFGVATANASIRSFEQLMGLADQGLYIAKNSGRNQVRGTQEDASRRPAAKPAS